jgi:hypothetical protein
MGSAVQGSCGSGGAFAISSRLAGDPGFMSLKGDILLPGEGAAGFFAAANATRFNRGLRVALIENPPKSCPMC